MTQPTKFCFSRTKFLIFPVQHTCLQKTFNCNCAPSKSKSKNYPHAKYSSSFLFFENVSHMFYSIHYNNNHLYSLYKRHIKHNAYKYQCVYTVHKIAHFVYTNLHQFTPFDTTSLLYSMNSIKRKLIHGLLIKYFICIFEAYSTYYYSLSKC